MKVESFLFLFCAAFFAATDVVYWYWSKDPTGTTALALSVGLALLIGSYLAFTGSRVDPRPEDDIDAEIADGSGEIGFYSPYSWWPLFLAGSAALGAIGIAVGWWLFIIGAGFTLCAAMGFVFEYYRGEFAH